MEPVGRELWNDPSAIKAFQLRHTEFFNGNPFMIPLVLGAVANMEERLRNGGSITADDISRFKTAVGQASGSIGDRIFWRTLRPFALAVGLLWSLVFGLWGVVLFLAIFNIPTAVLKWYWLDTGYRLGPKVVIALKNRLLDRSVKIMEKAGGLIIAFFAMVFLSGHGYGLSWVSGGTIFLFTLSVLLYSKLIPHSIVVALTAGIALLFGVFMSSPG